MFGPQIVDYLERSRKFGLVERGGSLRVSIVESKAYRRPCLSLSPSLPASCRPSDTVRRRKLNVFLYTLPLSWCLFTVSKAVMSTQSLFLFFCLCSFCHAQNARILDVTIPLWSLCDLHLTPWEHRVTVLGRMKEANMNSHVSLTNSRFACLELISVCNNQISQCTVLSVYKSQPKVFKT